MEQTNTLDVRRVAKAGDSVCRAITSHRDAPCFIASSQRVVLRCSLLRCVCNTLRWVAAASWMAQVRDIEEGRHAGCGLVIGVLSGADRVGSLPHPHRDCAPHICPGTVLAPATSAPGLGPSPPNLHRHCACPGHICAGTALTAAPHLRRDWARRRRTRNHAPSRAALSGRGGDAGGGRGHYSADHH